MNKKTIAIFAAAAVIFSVAVYFMVLAIAGIEASPTCMRFLTTPVAEITRYELYMVAIAAGLIFGK